MDNFIHISYSVSEDCINFRDSYGTICARCNACGRWNKETELECRLKMYKRHMDEQHNFDNWAEDKKLKKVQRENITENIKYLEQKIRETEKRMEARPWKDTGNND